MLLRSIKPIGRVWRRYFSNRAIKIDDPTVKIANDSSKPIEQRTITPYLFTGGTRHTFTVEPDLDFRDRLSDLSALRKLLIDRGYDDEIEKSTFGDWRQLTSKYDEWRRLSSAFVQTYTKGRSKELEGRYESDEHKKYVDDIKAIDELELDVIQRCLQLPADLHPWTPIGNESVRVSTFVRGERRRSEGGLTDTPPMDEGTSSHMDILVSTGPERRRPLIEFKHDPPQCFLLDDAADLLRSLEQYFDKSLFDAKYRRVSPAHFVRSSMVEAYYGSTIVDDDVSKSKSPRFIPIESIYGEKGIDSTWALNLAGHGPAAYSALFIRKALGRTNAFPLKLYSLGMAYGGKMTTTVAEPWTLFNFPIQRPRVTLFAIYENNEDEKKITDEIRTTIEDLLAELGLSFVSEQRPSHRLLMCEMSRVDLIAANSSSSNGAGVRFGSISNHGDFLSRRIRLSLDQHDGVGPRPKSDYVYPKCTYAEIDLFNVLARIYEERYRKIDSSESMIDDKSLWPSILC